VNYKGSEIIVVCFVIVCFFQLTELRSIIVSMLDSAIFSPLCEGAAKLTKFVDHCSRAVRCGVNMDVYSYGVI
jgi:uncharacterized membrane protein YczE